MYCHAHRVFGSKGDVWRLLASLNDVVDGRTWPEDHEPEVGSNLTETLIFFNLTIFDLTEVLPNHSLRLSACLVLLSTESDMFGFERCNAQLHLARGASADYI